MRYILNNEGYIETISFSNEIECNNKTCTEYTGTVPSGYSSLAEWSENAVIQAYKITNGNLILDADKKTELEAKWTQENSYGSVIGRVSKNLFDKNGSPILHMYVKTADNTFEDNYMATYSSYVKVEPNTTYTISKTTGKTFRVATSTNVPMHTGKIISTTANHTGSSITITTESDANYLFINYYNTDNGDSIGENAMRDSIQIEKGPTATEKEEYFEPSILVRNSKGVFQEVEINKNNYSTTEQRIGTWIDGKPLYRRVVIGAITEAMISASVKIADIPSEYRTKKLDITATHDHDGASVMGSTWFSDTDYIYTFINSNRELRCKVANTAYVGRELVCILEYTKTTD